MSSKGEASPQSEENAFKGKGMTSEGGARLQKEGISAKRETCLQSACGGGYHVQKRERIIG